jgi:hypothetical protein
MNDMNTHIPMDVSIKKYGYNNHCSHADRIDRIYRENYALRISPNNKEIMARIIKICINPVAFQ